MAYGLPNVGGAIQRRRMGGFGGMQAPQGFNQRSGFGGVPIPNMGQQPPWAMMQPLSASPAQGQDYNLAPGENALNRQYGPGGAWGRFGEVRPGRGYSWEDLSSLSDPQWLSGHLLNLSKLGYFGDPRDSALTDFSRQQAAQASGAMQRRAQTAGQVAGLPQGQRGFAYLQGMLGGQGQEASIINQLLRQQFEQQQDWARNLAAGFAGIPDTRAQTRAYEQAWMGPAGGVLGSILGGVLG